MMVDMMSEREARAEGLMVDGMMPDKSRLDLSISLISAFHGWDDLEFSIEYYGYVPTLRISGRDAVTDGAVAIVRRELIWRGFELYPVAGEFITDFYETDETDETDGAE